MLNTVLEENKHIIRTHSMSCHHWHVECLAYRVREELLEDNNG